jgi:DNA primase, catalytic core
VAEIDIKMIPPNTVATILETARVEEVVSEFVSLKKRGSNLIGLCPFHNEKTPSFIVSPGKNIFKCFGCGKAGDSAHFIMEHEHYTYPEALRYLAQKYNIEIEEAERTPEEIMAQNGRETMFNINTFANDYFTHSLWKTEEGQSIGLSYFHERGFLNPIIERFQLGYNPNSRDALTKHAIENGYSKELLLKIGLSVGNEDRLFDRFQGRVMFPVFNLTGKVIGFGGRILNNDKTKAKYMNSPESEIYDKKQTLYGIYFAKNAITKADNCILVEGYFDVLRMHQIGMENVVASSGTSLTKEQIRMIKRYTKNITMLYDGDAAGVKAALRGTDMILEEGMNVRVVVLPPEHDPDTFARTFPLEEVEDYLKTKASDFISFKTKLLLKDTADDPIKKSEVVRDIIQTIAVIPDAIYRVAYIRECSCLLDMPEQTLMNELNKLLRAKYKKELGQENFPEKQVVAPVQEITPEHPAGFYQECELVKLLILYGRTELSEDKIDENGTPYIEKQPLAQLIIDDLKSDGIAFKQEVHRKVFDAIDLAIDEGNIPEAQFFTSNEDETISLMAANLVSTPYKLDQWEKYGIFVKREEDVLKNTVLSTLFRYKDSIIDERRAKIEEELKATQDVDEQLILLQEKKKCDELKMKINKFLGVVIAK